MGQSLEAHIRKLQDLYWSDADPEGRGFVPLADAYRKAGDLPEARRILREGMERHPDFVSGHVVSAWLSLDQSRCEEAEGFFRTALALDPKNIAALKGLAGILLEEGEVEAALGFFRALLQEDPIDPALPARITELEERLGSAVEVRSQGEDVGAELPHPTWVDLDEVADELNWSSATVQADLPSGMEEGRQGESAFDWASFGGECEEAPLEEVEGIGDEDVQGIHEGGYAELGAVEGREAQEADAMEFDGPWVAEDGIPVPDLGGRGDTLVTSTLGEIYLRQGYLEWAEEVFRTVLERDPGNESLLVRLEEVRALRRAREGAAPEVVEPSLSQEPVPDVTMTGLSLSAHDAGAPVASPGPEAMVPVESPVPDAEVAVDPAAPDAIVPIDLPAPDAVVPIESLAPDVEGAVDPAAPDAIVPIDLPAPDAVVPIESLAPDAEVVVDPAAPDAIASIDLLAPDAVVPIESLAPDAEVVVDPAASDAIVPVDLLAPDAVVPIESLAPAHVVPIESLAPDPSAGGGPGTKGEADGGKTGDDRALDAFQAWLDTL